MNKLTLIVFSLPFLSACSKYMPELPDMSEITPDLSLPTPYKADVYQGSVLDRYTINQLKVGMTQSQVQDLIGSPSVIDPFHNNQWDYINHSTSYESDVVIRYRLRLTFKGNILSDIDTSGIASLPELTAKEKELENQRIAEEKAAAEVAAREKIEAERIAKEAAAKAEADRIAKEKELENQRIAEEKAAAEVAAREKIEAERIAKEAAAKAEADRIAEENTLKELQVKEESVVEEKADNKPWYQFW